jgi:RNA polymerase sigma-70 factor (ECF subfamily)
VPGQARISGKVSPAASLFNETEQDAAPPVALVGSATSAEPGAPTLTFESIYRTYFDDVRRWIRALGGPEAEREDLAQDVFVIVHRRLPDFDGKNVGGWLYQITRHRVRDFRRLRWFRLFLGKKQVDETLAASTDGPDAALRRKEGERVLATLLEKLPETQRSTFILFEIEGYSGEEIARFQGVTVNAVWARIHKARAKMTADLQRLQRTAGEKVTE